VEDGQAVLDKCETTLDFKLLILDYHMPRIDGLEVIIELRKMAEK